MRYDIGLPKERILLLESIVDGVLGIQEESYEENGAIFYREDLYHAAIFSEDFIKSFAGAMTTDGAWYGCNVRSALQQSIDATETALMRSLSFSETEMQLMKEEFIKRFCDRLNRYRKGRKLAYVHEGNDVIGFRWER